MNQRKFLNIKGALLDERQLEIYLEKIASEHNLQKTSDKKTYPIKRLDDNFKYITNTYDLLNRNLKEKIIIHPAGEWLLDNYYIIEEIYKTIKKELPLKKYKNFVGISNGFYKGFARIYVLAFEIVAYTEGKVDANDIKKLLQAYQNKKTLNMDEIWNISLFFYIALIEKIRGVCEKIQYSQIQKYKVESIIERLIENVDINNQKFKRDIKEIKIEEYSSKEAFVEYLSYRLKLYGKKGAPYNKILEEQVAKVGTTIPEIITKEHFNIAIQKVQIGNCIKSIKNIQRINFTEIFEEINKVESLLKEDPAKVYDKMDHKTKAYYRNEIKKLSQKTKISELYITRKVLELANKNINNKNEKKAHVGYYLISEGKEELKNKLGIKRSKNINKKNIYIGSIIFCTSIISFIISYSILIYIRNAFLSILFLLLIYIPVSEIVIKLHQNILSKIKKPILIPKLYFSKNVPKEYSTMVIIPTILDSKEKTIEMLDKLEVFYLANKSENIYFTLLGDCTTSLKQEEEFDKAIIEAGKSKIEELNKKYADNKYSKFEFIYRKRTWNEKENCYLGWERKRGIIAQINQFLLGNINNTFLYNSMKDKEIPKIKYIITLDADTQLVLDSAKELIGAMAHILNKPEIKDNVVIRGYGIIQPRIGIDIESSNKTMFTKIFAGNGGVDFYSNAISDIYQDNFNEGIYTGKGIYDLEVFNKVLREVIPENTVLSHDLLEGLYLKSGLATDIILFDSYPRSYNSYMTRQNRWIRGDWQIIKWLNKKVINKNGYLINNPLQELDKFKIVDNLRRSLLEITQLLTLILLVVSGVIFKKDIRIYLGIIFISIIIDFILDIFNEIIYKKEGVKRQDYFFNNISNIKASLFRGIIKIGTIPYQAYSYIKSISKTLYRVYKSKKNLLEWVTADEAEKNGVETLLGYSKIMYFNIIVGILGVFFCIINKYQFLSFISLLWIIAPWICMKISKLKTKKRHNKEQDIKYMKEIAQKTWKFFEDYLVAENNYLPPDNYQKSRKNVIVDRTSSTNIGLAIVSIISAYDLGFIDINKCLELLNNMIDTIKKLPKWEGHLYNWYNIKTLEPLIPRYISTVDSGNFTGYMFILLNFFEVNKNNEIFSKEQISQIEANKLYIEELINSTDFSKLYDEKVGLFSIGFNIEENKLTPSYYDLLASEARQASLISIAKNDVKAKHWNNLSKTLTLMDRKKGLISWSGTAFEYLMPNINMRRYEGSLLDESCKFMIMSQKKYCNQLGIPWGISESAFNLKDLNSNYQYKAFGIPWLGLKRGLADEIVVSSYGSFLALDDNSEDVIKNIKRLEQYGMYDEYGFYESIDFTPDRISNNKKYEIVKTYMAHHQALILLSINNFINNNILKERFNANPQIKAVDILLQEKMPEDIIVTKEKKEVVEKIKYSGNNSYTTRVINKIDDRINNLNVISNENYTICMNQDGTGFSKYKDILVNRYKETERSLQGIQLYFKNLESGQIWNNFITNDTKKEKSRIEFSPDKDKILKIVGNISTSIETIIVPNEDIEIRSIELKNSGNKTEILEVTSILEPVLSTANQDYAHKSFNNLFLKYEKIQNGLVVKRNKRGNSKKVYLATGFFIDNDNNSNLEYEIDKQKLYGRLNNGVPIKIRKSDEFSNEIGLVIDPIIAFRRKVKIKPNESIKLNLVISVGEDKLGVICRLNKYISFEKVRKAFEISKIRVEEEARYLRITGEEIEVYQKLLSYILKQNPMKKKELEKISNKIYKQQDFWKYGISGDNPIILVEAKEENDVYIIREILKAYEYFVTKNIQVDLIILDYEENIYEKYVRDNIEREIYNLGLNYLINKGIYLLDINQIEDINLFKFKANIIINAHKGSLKNTIEEIEEEYLLKFKKYEAKNELKIEENFEEYNIDEMDLKYKNGYGGFSRDGKEYIISATEKVPQVWSNVLTNPKFGTIVTQNMSGFTWSKNSRLNRISRWSNDTLIDTTSESIFIKDLTNKKVWQMGQGNTLATYGFGYAEYEQKNEQLITKVDMFVPIDDNVKINKIKIKNNKNISKNLKIIYKIDNVLDEDEIKSNGYIHLEHDKKLDVIVAQNLYPQDIKEKVFIYSSEKINSFTGNNKSINIHNTDNLNNEDSLGNDSCMAIEICVQLNSYEEKEVMFVLGAVNKNEKIIKKYNIQECEQAYYKTKQYWKELLSRLEVKTPEESIDIILNGWSMYQTIASRLYARSGFNQSGGAFGFRDQLQDCIGIEYLDSGIVKNQILKHAAHQFIEGDVEHWWHEENNRGIRTKFSDDRLWMVYIVLDYLSFTNDYKILEEEIGYVGGKILENNEDENYDIHKMTDIKETLYEHCKRAINISLKFGENGLPLIGTGDWNDGLNTVGNKGKGESVWLGFFLYDILIRFSKIVNEKEDYELANKYQKIAEQLKERLNTNGWDEEWYKRAFMDNGKVLGSKTNDECAIDSISQSWSVISEAGEKEKTNRAMSNLEKRLVNEDAGIIKLMDPPFEKSSLEPGYIKSYLPGVRENGGQYTHAAIWAIIAFAKLGLKEKAMRYYKMINSIEHSNTKEKEDIYKIEPYVISADIYGSQNLLRTRWLELVYWIF